MKTKALSSLREGEHASVSHILPAFEMSCRLFDLGFARGTTVECLIKRSKISAYGVRGSVIALRDCDAGLISVCEKT